MRFESTHVATYNGLPYYPYLDWHKQTKTPPNNKKICQTHKPYSNSYSSTNRRETFLPQRQPTKDSSKNRAFDSSTAYNPSHIIFKFLHCTALHSNMIYSCKPSKPKMASLVAIILHKRAPKKQVIFALQFSIVNLTRKPIMSWNYVDS